MRMGKRGEVSSGQLVGIILAIGGLIIIGLFFAAFYGEKDLIGREACHLSVLKRATIPAGGTLSPLDCTTEKICISKSGDQNACNQFSGEDPVRGVSINLDDIEGSKNIIEKESANALFDCWKMMGEGKIDVLTRGSIKSSVSSWLGFTDVDFSVSEPKCVVCSRLAISQEILEDERWNATRDEIDVNTYLRTHAVPQSDESYLKAFGLNDESYGGVDKRDEAFIGNISKSRGEGDLTFDVPKKSDQMAIVFMQIKSRDPVKAAEQVALGSLVIGAGGLTTSTGRTIAGAAIKTIGGIYTVVAAGALIGAGSYAAYNAADKSQDVAFGYCDAFKEDDEARLGCSIIRRVNWDVDSVNELCYGGIEGIL